VCRFGAPALANMPLPLSRRNFALYRHCFGQHSSGVAALFQTISNRPSSRVLIAKSRRHCGLLAPANPTLSCSRRSVRLARVALPSWPISHPPPCAAWPGSAVPAPFLVVLIFWLTIIFASFGLFAPLNVTVLATFLVCALSVSSAIFLILELHRS